MKTNAPLLEEIRALRHELQENKIELDMRNQELLRTREFLAETRGRYFDLYELSSVGYFTLSNEGLIRETNLAFATLLGVDREAVVNQSLHQYIWPDDQTLYDNFFERLVNTSETQSCELRLSKNDTDIWVQLNASIGKDVEGTDSFLVVVTDVVLRDKRILIVDDDASSAMLMRKLLKDHQCAIAKDGPEALKQLQSFNPDLVFLDVMMPGMDGFEVCQKIKENPLFRNIPIVMVTALTDRDSKVKGLEVGADEFLSKPIDPAELKIRTANILKANQFANFLENHNRSLVVNLLNTHKILEKDIAEHCMTKVELEIFHQFFRFSRDIMLFVDGNSGQIIDINPAAEAAYGYSREEAIGKHIFDLRAEEMQPLVKEQMLLAAIAGVTFETVHRHRDGRRISVEVSSKGQRFGDRNVLFTVIRDITDRKQIEAEKLHNQQRMSQMEKMVSLGTLAAGVAHEIKQPLNALKLIADGIVYWNDKGKKAEWGKVIESLKTISAHSKRIDAIVKRLQAFVSRTRATSDKETDVNEAVCEALDLIAENSRIHNVLVDRNLCSDSLQVWGDAGRLEEVVINIVVNAIQAMEAIAKAEKRVTVSTRREENNIVVEISNNGPNIPGDKLATIFEPFYSSKTTGDNMGLGLAIVKSIVEAHQGSIKVSNLNPGVSFRIELPGYYEQS